MYVLIDGHIHYIVMDHCQGGDLAQKIKEQTDSGQEFEEAQVGKSIEDFLLNHFQSS